MLMGLIEGAVPTAASTAAAFVGPADVSGWSSGIYAYWGLRAMNASLASTGTALVNLQRSSDSATMTLVATTNGYPDVSATSSFNIFLSSGLTTATVTQFYDQSGNGRHLNTSVVSKPTISQNVFAGGLPALFFTETINNLISASSATAPLAQPISIAGISLFSSGGLVFCDGSFGFQGLGALSGSPNNRYMQAGGARRDYTGVDGIFESIISVVDGSSSRMSINGTIASNGDPGSNGICTAGSSTNKLSIGAVDGGAALLDGYVYEVFVLAGARSTSQMDALTTNQRAVGTGF